jgi:hypothetical protein
LRWSRPVPRCSTKEEEEEEFIQVLHNCSKLQRQLQASPEKKKKIQIIE